MSGTGQPVAVGSSARIGPSESPELAPSSSSCVGARSRAIAAPRPRLAPVTRAVGAGVLVTVIRPTIGMPACGEVLPWFHPEMGCHRMPHPVGVAHFGHHVPIARRDRQGHYRCRLRIEHIHTPIRVFDNQLATVAVLPGIGDEEDQSEYAILIGVRVPTQIVARSVRAVKQPGR